MKAYFHRLTPLQTRAGVFTNIRQEPEFNTGYMIVHGFGWQLELYWTRRESEPVSVGDRGVW